MNSLSHFIRTQKEFCGNPPLEEILNRYYEGKIPSSIYIKRLEGGLKEKEGKIILTETPPKTFSDGIVPSGLFVGQNFIWYKRKYQVIWNVLFRGDEFSAPYTEFVAVEK